VTPPVFLVPQADLVEASAGSTIRVEGAEGRHAVTVRRLAVGEAVTLVDGAGTRAEGTVSAVIGKQSLDVTVESTTIEPPAALQVTVVQALPKGDRGELAVELLTEIGADLIVPWAAARCVTVWKGERAERGPRRWSDAAQSAAKQARRARLPEISPLASTADVVDRVRSSTLALVLHEAAVTAIGDVIVPATGDVLVIVGPEGGLTEDELQQFVAAGAGVVRIGPTVLRTSSAGIAAVAALLARSDRWSRPEMGG